MIGGGPQERALRQQAASLNLRGVTFRGRVAPESMAAQYSAADIYVQTPSVDNMPLSILEAFASGLPVVSTRVGGVPGMLRDGEQGLLAADDDDEGIAHCVLELLGDPARARRMAAAAYESCKEYAWARARGSWLAAYRQALSSSSDGQRVAIEATR